MDRAPFGFARLEYTFHPVILSPCPIKHPRALQAGETALLKAVRAGSLDCVSVILTCEEKPGDDVVALEAVNSVRALRERMDPDGVVSMTALLNVMYSCDLRACARPHRRRRAARRHSWSQRSRVTWTSCKNSAGGLRR